MGQLFAKDKRTISEHISNIFSEGELEKISTVRKFRTVQTEGKREVERQLDHYNLDVIISVGYRVKSVQGTQFRIWATQRLKEYIIKGFSLNDDRFKSRSSMNYFNELQGAHSGDTPFGEILLPKNKRHLRHQYRLWPEGRKNHWIFQNRAKQSALGNQRANRSRIGV